MNQTEREEAAGAVGQFLNESLERILLSNPVNPETLSRAKMRPLLIKDELRFQVEEQQGKQAFHRNLDRDQALRYVLERMDGQFRQAEIASALGTGLILVSKKGKVTVKVKRRAAGTAASAPSRMVPMSHNRRKRYVLEEGRAVPFLVDLGVMTKDGKVVNSRYDKFRQINRFLEMIEDVLPQLDPKRESTIIDFGCGKSYLTFCCGDIASYEGVDRVDMVVTLHACDTATDYALAKAVGWGAKVILSVPCCQHELNRQMESELLAPVLQYGLIKERMAALYTDALRAQVLEHVGYRTQILEFIDMEHTPKNILIRAVRQGSPKDNTEELQRIAEFLNVRPTLMELLAPEACGEREAGRESL